MPLVMKKSQRIADCSTRMGNNGGRSQAKIYRQQQQQNRPPKTLTRLVARRKWFEIENILSTSSIDWINIDEKGVITDECILQFALRYDAPLHVVKLLALRYPKCLTSPDSTGKYSCHVAAKYGASPEVMEFLLCENAYAAGVEDPLGKCPIHYVAEFYMDYNESGSVMAAKEDMLQVVRMLRQAAPQSFNVEDDEGCNAIEYAIANDVDIKIIKTMQRTARDDWRAHKASGHGKRHEELAKEIERCASESRPAVVLNDVVGSSVMQDHGQDPCGGGSGGCLNSYVAKSA